MKTTLDVHHLDTETLYEKFTRLGWTKRGGNSRVEFWWKGKWSAIVPTDIRFDVKFVRWAK